MGVLPGKEALVKCVVTVYLVWILQVAVFDQLQWRVFGDTAGLPLHSGIPPGFCSLLDEGPTPSMAPDFPAALAQGIPIRSDCTPVRTQPPPRSSASSELCPLPPKVITDKASVRAKDLNGVVSHLGMTDALENMTEVTDLRFEWKTNSSFPCRHT